MREAQDEKVNSLISYLVHVYGDLDTVSKVSGISLSSDVLPPDDTKRLVDFVLAHRRRSSMLSSFENDETPRFATPDELTQFDAEDRLLRAERLRYGY